jgi:hypothetical protein
LLRLYYVHSIVLLPVAKFCILIKIKILNIIAFMEVFTNIFASLYSFIKLNILKYSDSSIENIIAGQAADLFYTEL